jgi:hypothetical protein
MSDYERLPAVLATLEQAQRLVRTATLSTETAVRLEVLLEDALLDLRKAMGIAVWPEPTVEPPDWETLEEWMWDSVCEATDSCLVEPDVAP